MQALHSKYCQQLPDKYGDIEKNWKHYISDSNKIDYIEEFYRLIHTLKGTAATFGFNTQADICYKIQTLLLKNQENHSQLDDISIQLIQGYLDELKANISAPAQNMPV